MAEEENEVDDSKGDVVRAVAARSMGEVEVGSKGTTIRICIP